MATAEAETSHDEGASPGGVTYDGFISYSLAADDLLTPSLQAGLQRFANPRTRDARLTSPEEVMGAER